MTPVAPRLGDLRVAAKLQPGGAPRRRRIEPTGAMAICQHLQVEPQLLAEIALR
jgi:hypothetical protein